MCHPRSILKVGGRGALTHVPPQINFLYLCLIKKNDFAKMVAFIFFKFRENISSNVKFFGNFFSRNFASFSHFRFIHFREMSRISLWNTNEKFCLFSLNVLFAGKPVCATPDQSSRDGWGPQYMFHPILIFLVKDLSQSPNLLN